MCGEEGGGGGGLLSLFAKTISHWCNIYIWSLFLHVNNSKKTKQLLGFKKPRKKTRKLGFLRNDCAYWVQEKAENQGEILGSWTPSVLVGFLLQKRTVHTPSGQDGGGEGEGWGAAGPQQAEAARGWASLPKIH
jgi:hypothetical protein